jgi:hypothetical protein
MSSAENKESSPDEIVGRAFLLGEGKDAIQKNCDRGRLREKPQKS